MWAGIQLPQSRLVELISESSWLICFTGMSKLSQDSRSMSWLTYQSVNAVSKWN